MNKIELYNDGIGAVEYVSHMGDDLTVVNSARVSFGKHKDELDDRDRKLIQYLIRHKHTSTLEHNLVTFRFCVPLFVRSQHHRHRTWSYNEISRRYTEVGIQFYEPQSFRTQHKSNRQGSNLEDMDNPMVTCSNPNGLMKGTAERMIQQHHSRSFDLFNSLLEAGVCREQARGVLPQNMYTEYYGTVNLNNLLKFIDLRTHEGAQWEIRKAAEACLKIALELWPISVSSYMEIKNESL